MLYKISIALDVNVVTDEIFEKAVEIRDTINTIIELQGVLGNSKDNSFDNRYLAAIDARKIKGFVVEECKVLNHIKVPENIMKRFEEILWDELEKARNEFKTL